VIVTNDNDSITSKLQFEDKRRLIFDKDSLALKSLQEGIVDFSDKRINLKASALDQSLSKSGPTLLEVEIGDLKSL
jgi:hypothetical protein